MIGLEKNRNIRRLMSRSRSINRFNRLTAKRRRRALRAEVPSHGDTSTRIKVINHSFALRDQALKKEVFLDLIEPGMLL